MPAEERLVNADRLRWMIERNDINAWLRQQLDAVSELNL